MDAIEELKKRTVKAPIGGEKVYKDECAFSFDNPVSLRFLQLEVRESY